MKKQYKHIIALAIIVLPFYCVALLQKIFFSHEQIIVEEYLGYYMLLGILGIATVLLTNRYLLQNPMTVFRKKGTHILIELALTGVLLSVFYLLSAISRVSYGIWFDPQIDRTTMNELLSSIFDNTLYSLLIIGPFSWFNEGFISFAVAFLLIGFWGINSSSGWVRITIVFTALLTALLQIDNGIPAIINSFVIMSIFGWMFYKYRSFIPLLLASIIHQTIDLAAYWYYM